MWVSPLGRHFGFSGRRHTLLDKARLPAVVRDVIARMTCPMSVSAQDKRKDARAILEKMGNEIVGGLERQGFDPREDPDVRYADDQYQFRPKLHLGQKRRYSVASQDSHSTSDAQSSCPALVATCLGLPEHLHRLPSCQRRPSNRSYSPRYFL